MRAISIGCFAVLMAWLLVACQSTQNNWHVEHDVIKNTRIERNPGLITAPYTKVITQECPTSARIDPKQLSGYDNLHFEKCSTMYKMVDGIPFDHWDQAFEPGTLNGMGGSIIQAGAILGGAAILSNGYKQGGSRLNTNTSITQQNQFIDNVQPGGGHSQAAK